MKSVTGQCMCGQVKYKIDEEVSEIVSCHCKDCQRLHGNYNPMVIVDKTNFSLIDDTGITWYASSLEKSRGFCKNCGAALFMRQEQGPKMLISVGSLDDTVNLKNVKNVFTKEAGQYYVIPPEQN